MRAAFINARRQHASAFIHVAQVCSVLLVLLYMCNLLCARHHAKARYAKTDIRRLRMYKPSRCASLLACPSTVGIINAIV